MKTKTIVVYADPGHAWAKVSLLELQTLGIADEISGFSYERKDYVYLEEDCDLGIYCEALKSRNVVYKFKQTHTNRQSKIRSYRHYQKCGNVELK